MYDLIIIWAWSAGLPAWIYASRYWIKNLIIWELLGWALTQSHSVKNYPWFKEIGGKELMDNFLEHAKESWSEILNDKVAEVIRVKDFFSIKTSSWKEFQTKYILIASGNKYRHLGLEEEENFIWKGVSYCATCDGMFFRDREVAIIGGGNTALTEALYLSEICKKVYIVHRRDTFRAEAKLVEQAKKKENIEFVLNTQVKKINGDFFMESISLDNWQQINVEGLFVAIWNEPDVRLFEKMWISTDEEGYIVVDKRQKTNIDWIYAAWDITTNSNKFKQTLISAAEWALAAASIHEDLMMG